MPPPKLEVEAGPRLRSAKPRVLAPRDLLESIPSSYQILADDCEFLLFSNGAETIEFCAANHPDIVLLTDKLQDMDSLEVVRQLKKTRSTAEIGVIYITSEPNPLAEVQAFAAGTDDCLTAPLNPQVLRARLRHQLEFKAKCDGLQSLAATDSLTGLANRRRFNEALDQEWKRTARDQIPLSLLMLDVDHFKAFNDLYGHPAGDECLQAISEILKPFARRPGDLVARYGGEEFVIVLPGASEAYAIDAAKNMLSQIRNLSIPHASNRAGDGFVTASAGLATVAPHQAPSCQETLLSDADQMLYEAKRMGRDRVMSRSLMLANAVALIPQDEARRIAAVEAFSAARSKETSAYLDKIAQLAAALLETPIGLVSLVGRDNQIFVGRHGLEVPGTPREVSFCAHAINGDMPLIVPNAAHDPRFQANPLVTGDLGIRFYAGAPLVSQADGTHMGALCVIDRIARRPLPPDQTAQLTNLAKLAIDYIDRVTAPPNRNVLLNGAFCLEVSAGTNVREQYDEKALAGRAMRTS